jgi:cyclopropane fatty-acyl-phospholipid synthase-like methyltransferase
LLSPYRKGEKLLDVGCSSGYFLSIAAHQGYAAMGIEPNSQEAGYARRNGVNIIGSTIDDLSASNELFDVITLWDVLEHIQHPVDYIAKLRLLLNQYGLVFVQVPTSDSLAARIMREDCNMFDGIEHLTLFSSRSLDTAFQSAGFTCVAKSTVISEIHAITNYLSYQSDPYLDAPLVPFKTDFLSATTLESSGQGYKIQAVYQLVK